MIFGFAMHLPDLFRAVREQENSWKNTSKNPGKTKAPG